MRLAFTGHRPESLPFGENELPASAIRIKTLLADEIMRCAAQGYDTFLAGGARGGDILFAGQVLFVKAGRRRHIEIFLHMLEEQKECADFEPGMFVALVDKVIIQHDGHMGFCFRNGMKCEYPQ